MKTEKITEKHPAKKIARQRLTVLQRPERLGNITEACRQLNMDRISFYEWKRRFQTHGIDGLVDMPPIHRTHPQTTPPETVERILATSIEHPGCGCVRLSDWLKLDGVSVSSPTIQNILIRNGMGSKYNRLMRLEERHLVEGIELSVDQVAQIEKTNPCFRERHVESSRPGEQLFQDTFYVARLKGVGLVYMQA